MKNAKKCLIALVLLAVLSPLFAQEEYNLYYSGDIKGIVAIQKDKKGKITITHQKLSFGQGFVFAADIDNSICLIIPANKTFSVFDHTASIVIDGKTTTDTWDDGRQTITVVDGKTTTETSYNGKWEKTVVDGNTTTKTYSDGSWSKTVVTGNTTMFTSSYGEWIKTVVDDNTTTVTRSSGTNEKTVVEGNTTTRRYDDGYWIKTVVDGNTTTETHSSGRLHKTVVDKQEHDIFITEEWKGPW